MSTPAEDLFHISKGDVVRIKDRVLGFTHSDHERPTWRRYIGQEVVVSKVRVKPTDRTSLILYFDNVKEGFHSDHIECIVSKQSDVYLPPVDCTELLFGGCV